MALPLLTKALIDNVSAARADGITGLRPAPSTIGMAVGLFGLMVFGNMCIIHSMRISNLLGATTRGAVNCVFCHDRTSL